MRTTSVILLILGVVSYASAAGDYTAVMDLSYKPHVSARKISSTVRDSIAAREHPPTAVELDVSFSEMGNEGIASLIQALLNTTESTPMGLSLASRMNRLSPEGVSAMLNSLLGNDGDDTNNDNQEADTKPSLVLQSLDLGWNNLGPGQTGSKDFLSSLRKLIESPAKCPTVLRLYRCGLGPAACRAIGKV
jgi:hypothetical protein